MCDVDAGRNQVLVLSFAQYCRWRALVQRVGGQVDKWVQSEHFALLGGQRVTGDTRVLFCRDTFHHPNLRHHDTRQNQYSKKTAVRRFKKVLHYFVLNYKSFCFATQSSSQTIKTIGL